MITVSGQTAGDSFEVLPVLPLTVGTPVARPVERIRFLRDEVVNVGWAVEVLLPDQLGQPRNCLYEPARQEATVTDGRTAGPSETDVHLSYRLQTSAPAHWLPLIPRADARTGWIGSKLVLGGIRNEIGEVRYADSQSQVLKFRGSSINSNSIPRTGMALDRRWTRALDAMGTPMLWMARGKMAGQGEGSSGLEFDIAKDDRQR